MNYCFIVVGVGGTGSLLARDLVKLCISTDNKICLIDGDVVERKNMVRQSYQEHDIGENKAVALSNKINTLYDVQCDAINKYLVKNELEMYIRQNFNYVPVLIGCVDNDATRKILEEIFNSKKTIVYIDSANGEYEGNIYVALRDDNKTVGALRSQSYELDDDLHPLDESCEVQAAKGNVQYLVTNTKMACSILEICNALLNGGLKVGVQSVKRFNTVFYE